MQRVASADPPHLCRARLGRLALIVLFISEAQAQVAEATQAAQQAAQVILEQRLLGAICILLALALAVALWRNAKLQDRLGEVTSQLATIAANSTSAIASYASATDRMQTAQAAAAETLREQGAETAREISELRHAQNNHLAGVDAVMRLLAQQRQGAA